MRKYIRLFWKTISIDRYYEMDNRELENEASKYRIGGYASSNGGVIRERIIEQLIKKDQANNSRFAVVISVFALVVSILSLIF